MNLLLDTHVVLWALTDDPTLSAPAREAIIDPGNDVHVSAVSAWEIAIKKRLGKLTAPDDLEAQVRLHRFSPLGLSFAHAAETERLPPIHRDPFDRALVAQARVENLTLATHDRAIAEYDVDTLLA